MPPVSPAKRLSHPGRCMSGAACPFCYKGSLTGSWASLPISQKGGLAHFAISRRCLQPHQSGSDGHAIASKSGGEDRPLPQVSLPGSMNSRGRFGAAVGVFGGHGWIAALRSRRSISAAMSAPALIRLLRRSFGFHQFASHGQYFGGPCGSVVSNRLI